MFNNNIQRILSARLGTQVPKFQNPAMPLVPTPGMADYPDWLEFEKLAPSIISNYNNLSDSLKINQFNQWKENKKAEELGLKRQFEEQARTYLPKYGNMSPEEQQSLFNQWKQNFNTNTVQNFWDKTNGAEWITDSNLKNVFNAPTITEQKQPETNQFNTDPDYAAFKNATGIDMSTFKGEQDLNFLGEQYEAWKAAGSPGKWEFGANNSNGTRNYDVTTKMQVNKDVQKALSPALNGIGSAFGVSNLGDKVSNTINTFNNSIDLTGTNKALEKVNKDLNTIDLNTEAGRAAFNQKKQERDDLLKKAKTNATMNLVGQGVGLAADITDEYIRDQFDYSDEASSVNGQGRKAYDAVANSLMNFSPYGTVAGGAMKVLGTVNDLAGKKTERFTADQDTINQLGGSYAGSASNITEAASKANKKFGLLDGSKVKKINKQIQEARRQQGIMQDLASEAQDYASSQTLLSQADALSYQFQLNGGYDQRYMRAAKDGAKIQYFKEPFKVQLSDCDKFEVTLSDVPTVLKQGGTLLDKLDKASTFKVVLSDVPPESFKKGGQIKDREIEVIETNTNQKSVIPEGALHKNKHHLNDVGVDDSELTKKGIPVVDNQGDQQAEIELNEIIFTLEVTKELETRYKEFYEEGTSESKKNELAEEAGKLLWKEILYNTDDRTGLIDTLKKGGTLKAQEGIQVPDVLSVKVPDQSFAVKHKPLYQEWIKTVNPDYINPNYDLETAYKYLPFEQMERWRFAVNQPTRKLQDYYLNYQDPKTGEYIYHTGFIAMMPNGDYIFLKKGTEKTNPELHWETDTYHAGTNGLKETYDLVYDAKEGRYFYRKKKAKKHEFGGTLTQSDIDKMVKQALINILTNG